MANKSQCAVSLGRKGGLAAKRKKVGIHAPEYKAKVKAKAAKKTTKKRTQTTTKKPTQATLFKRK